MGTYDFEIYKGVTLNLGITLNSVDGSPIDLTDYLISGEIKNQYSDLSGVALSVTKIFPFSSGQILVNLASDKTELLPITTAFYDIKINQGDTVSSVLNGKVFVYPTVT